MAPCPLLPPFHAGARESCVLQPDLPINGPPYKDALDAKTDLIEVVMQGQSKATKGKKRALGGALAVNMDVFNGARRKVTWKTVRYLHLEFHAGCGYNHEVGVQGSPIAFVKAAAAKQFEDWWMICIDKDREAYESLMARPEMDDPRILLIHGDNAKLCMDLPRIIRLNGENPRYAMGTIFIDPNRPTKEIPWRPLAWLFKQCPRLDVIVNFPATAMKRIGKAHKEYMPIDDLPVLLQKKDWLIRELQNGDPWQWCMCIGRNYKVGDFRTLGFHHWDSQEGREIRQTVMFTKNGK